MRSVGETRRESASASKHPATAHRFFAALDLGEAPTAQAGQLSDRSDAQLSPGPDFSQSPTDLLVHGNAYPSSRSRPLRVPRRGLVRGDLREEVKTRVKTAPGRTLFPGLSGVEPDQLEYSGAVVAPPTVAAKTVTHKMHTTSAMIEVTKPAIATPLLSARPVRT